MIVYPEIDPVALSIGPLKIHWYGLMYLIGFVGAWYYGVQRTKRKDIHWSRKQVEDVIFYGALGVILGGRLGYTLFYNFPAFLDNPISILYIWQGGSHLLLPPDKLVKSWGQTFSSDLIH